MREEDGNTIAASKLLKDAGENTRALRESQERLAHEVAGARTLQAISTRLISEVTQESLFAQLLDAAMELMKADFSSIQLLAPDGRTLVLLGWQNFHPASAAHWRHITTDQGCACGMALREQKRVLISDVEASEFIEEGEDLEEYRRSGIRAVQSTPLYSRAGDPLGMISTHWRDPHEPTDSELTLFDVLARQAADLIERTRAEEASRESEERQAYLLKLSDVLRAEPDADALGNLAMRLLGEKLGLDRCYLSTLSVENERADITHQFHQIDAPPMPETVRLSTLPEIMRIIADQTLVMDNASNHPGLTDADRQTLSLLGLGAAVGVPLRKGAQGVIWALTAASAKPRRWSPGEIALLEEVTERIWAAIERTRAETALRASEAKYRSLFESMDEAFYLIEIVRDKDGRPADLLYLDENAAGIRLVGMSVTGKRLAKLNPGALPEWLPIIDRVTQTGNSERFERLATSTGRWQHYHVFPAGTGKDRVGILSKDISSRKLAEEALRQSEEKFRAIANMAPVIIWMSDANHRCEYVNQPWLDFTGQSLEDVIGEGWAQPIHPEDVPAIQSIYEHALERRDRFQMDFRLRRVDGQYRWIVSTGAPRFHADGSFAGYVGSSVDVTDRRQAEEAMATINQRLADAQEDERARIARELHDDVVQRLVGLGWRLGAANDPSPAAVSESGAREIDNVRSEIMSLARDVQTLSHRLHPAWMEFLGVAAAVKALCREVSRHSGVEITCQVDDIPDGLSRENAVCLHRVLQEALQNAVKHSRATKVEVSLRSVLCEIEMTVRDFGVGFDTAARVHPGLGLTSMKERLKSVGGRLSIASQPDGTTLQAYVPISQSEPDKAA